MSDAGHQRESSASSVLGPDDSARLLDVGVPEATSRLPLGRLQVEQFALKLHGVDREGARRITERAMQLVSERIPADAQGRFDSLQLQVRPRRYTEAGMSEAIAEAITRAVTDRKEDGRA